MKSKCCSTRVGVFAVLVSWVTCCVLADGTPEPAQPLKGFVGAFDRLDQLAEDASPCVVLIDTTGVDEMKKAMATPGGHWRVGRLQSRITALSGLNCYCFHFTQLTRRDLDKPHVKAIVLTAGNAKGDELHKSELYALLRETSIPTIGFCNAHHHIYQAYGGKCVDMRKLKPGEVDPNPKYCPGMFKEWGFMKVRIVKRDPIFEGLGDEPVMLEQHVSECKELPDEFENLAGTDECSIQAIKHKTKLLYGTQFHPECYEEGKLDGKVLLQNFFKLAGAIGPLSR